MREWIRLMVAAARRKIYNFTVQVTNNVLDETERRCIKAVCCRCRADTMAEWDSLQRRWVHHVDSLMLHNYFHCPAHGIYEIRRIRNMVKEASE